MSGFVRRFTALPTLATLLAIEGTNIIDIAPPDPITGAGSGAILLVGEFEDGAFATDAAAKGAVEVLGSEDFRTKFGSLGYTYSGVVASNPCARKHLTECWNGNGYIKAFKMRAQRLLIARVDSSVGSVSFDVLASIVGGTGPFVLAAGQTLSITTNTGTGATAALTATAAVAAGASQAFASIISGDTFGISIDGGPVVVVTFGASDISQATVIARVNATLGFTSAVAATTEVNFQGLQLGTGGRVVLSETTTGVLAKLGHTAGTSSGVSNIAANINAVTAAEVATFVNGTAAITSVNGAADVDPLGRFRLLNTLATSVATIQVAAGAMATALGLSPIGSTVGRSAHAGGTIPAGTRLRASSIVGQEWVTMQTVTVAAGATDPISVKVRPALDDGTALGAGVNTINTIVDPISFAALDPQNAAALSAALSEITLDARYQSALDATLNEAGLGRVANYLVSARRSDAVVRGGRANVIRATECGLAARKFITGDPLGTTVAQSLVNVALWRSDRVFYTTKGWKVQVPLIAQRGTAGGIGFTADGIITVRPDGPLATICAILPPEENPAQASGLIEDFFEVNADGESLTIETYTAWKAAGICAPRVDFDTGPEYQSGVTSSLESGRTTIARRKMADFIQDSLVIIGKPFVKQLSKRSRRDKLRGRVDQFLAGLKSESNPELARIEDFSVDDSVNAGNTPDVLAQGAYFIKPAVRTLSSLDAIVFQTEIGPNAVIVTQQ